MYVSEFFLDELVPAYLGSPGQSPGGYKTVVVVVVIVKLVMIVDIVVCVHLLDIM